MTPFARNTPADVPQRAAVTRCSRPQREKRSAGEREPHYGGGARQSMEAGNGGFVQVGVDMTLHLDVFKASLPKLMRLAELLAQIRRNRCRWDLEDLWRRRLRAPSAESGELSYAEAESHTEQSR